jgi:hypothetical protein
MPVIITQCSGAKNPGLIVARDKYNTRFHSAVRKFMASDRSEGWRWFILSAAHGLLNPSDLLDNYEMTLRNDFEIATFEEPIFAVALSRNLP